MENEFLLPGHEELSREFNDLASYYSDYHKDVWGTRPRHMSLIASYYPSESTLRKALREVQVRIADLDEVAPKIWDEEKARKQKCIEDFERQIALNMSLGARDRDAAIGWICQAHDVENEDRQMGWEHLEYLLNIPFGYIRENKDK